MWFPNRSDTELFKHRRWLEAGNFGFGKKRNCTNHVVKTKMLISFAVSEKLLISFTVSAKLTIFVFANAICWFSDDAVHFSHEAVHFISIYCKLVNFRESLISRIFDF